MEPVPAFWAAVNGFINGIMNVRNAFRSGIIPFMTDLNAFMSRLNAIKCHLNAFK